MIKSIKLKNFQSWPELEFDVTQGVTLIKGFNHDDGTAEGSGKSAILNAICWCLFGQIPKDANIDDVIRQGEKSCEVFVKLSDGYTVERRRKPNDLLLWAPYSHSPKRGKDSKETQKLIEKHIGFTYETFLQSVYFAQNSLMKFLLLNEDGKGRILSQIAICDIFDSGRKKAHEIAREAFLKLNIEKNKLSEMNNGLQLIQNQINALRDVRLKFEAERLKAIGQLELKRDDIKKQIENNGYITILSPDYYAKLNELKTTHRHYQETAVRLKVELNQQSEKQMRKNSIEKQIKDSFDEIEKIQQQDHKCDTCGSILESIPKQVYLQSKVLYIQQKKKELQELKFEPSEKIEKEYLFYNTTAEQIYKDLKDVEIIELEIKHKREKLSMLSEQAKTVERELQTQRDRDYPDIDKRVELLQASVFQREFDRDSIANSVKELSNKHSMYETIKDGFKEVKALSFQETLIELNNRTNHYMAELFEQPVQIKFSNISGEGEVSKIETCLVINGEERALGLFSGGQTRRIMLAVDLAISDIIHSRMGKTDKLLILDEYFKDLSEESMQKVCRLLTNFDGSVIIIEHNQLINSLVNTVFEIEYKNGESYQKV